MPPGPPPWSCSVFFGCISDGICDEVEGALINFHLSEVEGENQFIVEGFRGHKLLAATFPTLQQVKIFLRKEIDANEVSMFFSFK